MNNKKALLALSFASLGLASLLLPLTQGHTFNLKASNSKTVDVLSLLQTALEGKTADITPSQYTLYSETNGVSYVFEVSNVYLDGDKNLVIKRDGYVRNITAFNGLSNLAYTYDGPLNSVDAILGSYDEETDMIIMDKRIEKTRAVVGSTNFSLRNKDSAYEDQTITQLTLTYSCTNGDTNNVVTESKRWSADFDFYNTNQTGEELYPYCIYTCAGMRALARVNNSGVSLKGKYFQVEENLDFEKNGIEYIPIGNNSNSFDGTFFGNGCLFVLNETIQSTTSWGIFGIVGKFGAINDVSVTGELHINSCGDVGSIAGTSYGTLHNIVSVMEFSGIEEDSPASGSNIGGIVGRMYDGQIDLASSAVDITVDSNSGIIGGIVGYMDNNPTINNVSYYGDLTAPDEINFVGGLVGILYHNIYYEEVITNYLVSSDSNLHFNFSYTQSGVTTQVNTGVSENHFHGRHVGYSTYVAK